MEKCQHERDRDYCCECRYGEVEEIVERDPLDLVEELELREGEFRRGIVEPEEIEG